MHDGAPHRIEAVPAAYKAAPCAYTGRAEWSLVRESNPIDAPTKGIRVPTTSPGEMEPEVGLEPTEAPLRMACPSYGTGRMEQVTGVEPAHPGVALQAPTIGIAPAYMVGVAGVEPAVACLPDRPHASRSHPEGHHPKWSQ